MAGALAFAVAGPVATITICRPDKSNALAPEHFQELANLLRRADADPAIRTVVLTGAGERAFCAGADLSEEVLFFERLGGSPTTGLGDVLRAAHGLRKPLVGRINGHCYAGGVGLLAACDGAVAADDVRFALPEIRLGLFPFVVVAGLSAKLAPVQLAGLALTGEPIGAERALAIGLIGQAVPRPLLDEVSAGLAASLARQPPAAVALGLAALKGPAAAFEAALAAAEAETRRLAARRGPAEA